MPVRVNLRYKINRIRAQALNHLSLVRITGIDGLTNASMDK